MEKKLIQIVNLKKEFVTDGTFSKKGTVKAVNGVSFNIFQGETLGLVGESGCGKSTLGRTIIRLYKPSTGKILYEETEISSLTEKQLKPIRRKMQIIFQDPFSSLNPRLQIGKAIEEPIIIHNLEKDKEKRRNMVYNLLDQVGLRKEDFGKYPHEFSGGQRQRIGIARAIAAQPDFIVADEPVSALDVSIQAQILNLILDIQQKYNLTILFISHDLRVVARISDRVAVMYLGKIVEIGKVEEIYNHPTHPYTNSLLSSIPGDKEGVNFTTVELKGDIPSPYNIPKGCPLHPRCPFAKEICKNESPELEQINKNHYSACFFKL